MMPTLTRMIGVLHDDDEDCTLPDDTRGTILRGMGEKTAQHMGIGTVGELMTTSPSARHRRINVGRFQEQVRSMRNGDIPNPLEKKKKGVCPLCKQECSTKSAAFTKHLSTKNKCFTCCYSDPSHLELLVPIQTKFHRLSRPVKFITCKTTPLGNIRAGQWRPDGTIVYMDDANAMRVIQQENWTDAFKHPLKWAH
jgi:hypothetical protein